LSTRLLTPRFLGTAAATVLLAGTGVGIALARGEPATQLAAGRVDSVTEATTATTAGGSDDGATVSSRATTESSLAPDDGEGEGGSAPSSTAGASADPIDLAGAVELGPSLDGTLRLFAVPDADQPGCEGSLPTWQLQWVDGDGRGRLAIDQVFATAPALARGSDGRVSFLSRCEESTFLRVGTETEADLVGPLRRLRPTGWEDHAIQRARWQPDSDIIVLAVSHQAASGDVERHRLEVDSRTGEVAASEPAGEGEDPTLDTCSADQLTGVTVDHGRPWSDLAADIQLAALDCDYERLADLAGPDFVDSFGAPGDFAQQLRTDEAFGYEPTRRLALLLEADPGEPAKGSYLVWPAFFACEDTCGMDEAEVRRLGYTDDDIASFREFGGYTGYRVLFEPNADGSYTWTVFVAGD
jgi:hypothetical protein